MMEMPFFLYLFLQSPESFITFMQSLTERNNIKEAVVPGISIQGAPLRDRWGPLQIGGDSILIYIIYSYSYINTAC